MTALRVLVVDDEALARLRLRSLVAECPSPAAVVAGEAANAAQALAWLAANECDVVLLDIRMPGRDGLQLAEDLRALRGRRRWCSSPRTPTTRSRPSTCTRWTT